MIHLSIVIPAIGTQSQIDDTLVSVLENRPSDCEIVVVHPPTYSDPYEIGDEVRFVPYQSDSSARKVSLPQEDALAMFNAGFQHSSGQVVHTLLPGITVGAGWCDSVLKLFDEDRNIGSVSPCIVARGRRKTIQGVAYDCARGKRIVRNAKRQIVAPLLGTGFYRASSLRFMHGFQCRFGPYADVELGLRMRSANYKAVSCDSRIHSDSSQRLVTVSGFRGGRLRGDLFAQARRVGLSTAGQGWMALLTEPLRNGFGAIGAVLGRATSNWARNSSSVVSIDEKLDRSTDGRRDEKAA